MSFSHWLRNWMSGSAERRSRPARQHYRPRLELLEDRCLLASGWVDWQEWPAGPDSLTPDSPTTSDVINFAFDDHRPANIYSTYPSLSFDLPNKAIDVVFLPSTPGFWGEPPQGLYGQLWALDAGDWTLRGPQSTLTFTITGDPVRWLEISDVAVAEGDTGTTSAEFKVSLSVASEQTVTVDFATADWTAYASDNDYSSGNDYVPVSGSLTFAPGETTKTITVQVNSDTVDEYYESFHVNLSHPTNARLGPFDTYDQGWGTIRDDESSLGIYSWPGVQNEGDSGITDFVFTVYMLGPRDVPVTVDFATYDGSAQASDNDYVPTSGLLTFAPGEDTKTITVQVKGDTRNEFDEDFFVSLGNPTNATLANAQAQGVIRNDDTPPPPPFLTINTVDLAEGDTGFTDFVFTVSLSHAADDTVTVDYATDDVWWNGHDYVPTSGTLTFAPGETTKTITVQVLGDLLDESDKYFVVNLSSPAGAYIASYPGQGHGTIRDDDPPPALTINDVTRTEGKAGISYFVFTVTLSAASDKTVSVNFATADGSAKVSNSDYVAASGALTFAPGETTKTITIQVKGDKKKEANETFFLNLSGAVDAIFADSQGLGVILDDD